MSFGLILFALICCQPLFAMDDSELGTEMQPLNIAKPVKESELFPMNKAIFIQSIAGKKVFHLRMRYTDFKIVQTQTTGGIVGSELIRIDTTQPKNMRLIMPLIITIADGLKNARREPTGKRYKIILTSLEGDEYEINEIGNYRIEQKSDNEVKLIKETKYWNAEITPKVPCQN